MDMNHPSLSEYGPLVPFQLAPLIDSSRLTAREKLELAANRGNTGEYLRCSWREDPNPPTLSHQLANEAPIGEEQEAVDAFYRSLIGTWKPEPGLPICTSD